MGLLVAILALAFPHPARADDAKVCEAAYEHAQELMVEKSTELARAELAVCMRACPQALAEDCRRWAGELKSEPSPSEPRPAEPRPTERPVIVVVPPPPSQNPRPAPEDPPASPQQIAGIVVGSFGVAALAASAILAITGHVERANLEDECSPACAPERADGVRRQWTASGALAGAGGALVGVGLVVYFTAEVPAPSRPTIGVQASSDGVGARLSLGF